MVETEKLEFNKSHPIEIRRFLTAVFVYPCPMCLKDFTFKTPEQASKQIYAVSFDKETEYVCVQCKTNLQSVT